MEAWRRLTSREKWPELDGEDGMEDGESDAEGSNVLERGKRQAQLRRGGDMRGREEEQDHPRANESRTTVMPVHAAGLFDVVSRPLIQSSGACTPLQLDCS